VNVTLWPVWAWELKAKIQYKLDRPLLNYESYQLRQQLQPLSSVQMACCLYYMAASIESDNAIQTQQQQNKAAETKTINSQDKWFAWFIWAYICALLGQQFTAEQDQWKLIDESLQSTLFSHYYMNAATKTNSPNTLQKSIGLEQCMVAFPSAWLPASIELKT